MAKKRPAPLELIPYIVAVFARCSTDVSIITSYSDSVADRITHLPTYSSAYKHFPKNNDFVLPNALGDEETSLHPFYK